jgi:hypothetical protein
MGEEEVAELIKLESLIEEVDISESKDQLIWDLEPFGKFSSRSLYRLMSNPGEVDIRMKNMWEVKLQLKIRIFFSLDVMA